MDGEQILVLEKTVAVTNGATGGAGALTGPIGAGGRSAKVNLNQATVAQLDTLPGIGPAIAQRIVDWRTANGPFRSLSDLTKISGIGEKLVSGIRDAVVLP
jgi:competence protein ComEA